jgi:hypothetical protein
MPNLNAGLSKQTVHARAACRASASPQPLSAARNPADPGGRAEASDSRPRAKRVAAFVTVAGSVNAAR